MALNGPRIREYQQAVPRLFSQMMTEAHVSTLFTTLAQLPPVFAVAEYHKLWNRLSSESHALRQYALTQIQFSLRSNQSFLQSTVYDEEVVYWQQIDVELNPNQHGLDTDFVKNT